jgi:hypothetical protein
VRWLASLEAADARAAENALIRRQSESPLFEYKR